MLFLIIYKKMNTKYILLITLVCFCYPLKHCLQGVKICNSYKISIPHCKEVLGNQCFVCEENYSVSNDRHECINIPNCRYFSEDGKCSNCNFYYNFDTNGNCVVDSCLLYDENRKCYQCYNGYILNNDRQCEKISVKYCAELDENNNNKCKDCYSSFKIENGNCVLENNNFIEGCEEKNTDGTCNKCNLYYDLNNGKCTFNNKCGESDIYEMCYLCEDGYYLDDLSKHCLSMDGTKDTDDTDDTDDTNDTDSDNKSDSNDTNTVSDDSTSNGNIVKGININFALIYLLLALI